MGLRCKESDTLGFIPTDLDNEEEQYDFMEDSTKEVNSSSDSHRSSSNRLSRFFSNIKGKFS